MILGILSDSHGRAARTAAALRLLRICGAETFIHCGDIGSPEVLDEFIGKDVHFVWGNNDDERGSIARYASSIGQTLPVPPRQLFLAGHKIVVFHGHERGFADLWRGLTGPAGAHSDAAYVLYGHSHVPADDRRGNTRFINPGALHRAAMFTVATLDLSADIVRHYEVRDDAAAGDVPRRVTLPS